MPRYSERTDALRRYVEREADEQRIRKTTETVRQLGPVTAKAKRFDFGRKPR